MPMTGWNGKFQSAGGAEGANSAVGGSINYAPMREALRSGYGTAGTDGGHHGATLGFAPGIWSSSWTLPIARCTR
jgi:hypothetical protein